ncbi:MAG: SDR family oxidoreductase [Acidobacteria bacterium]|nr:SDR family oxidoreductase [Acidobacteriota bacterium]
MSSRTALITGASRGLGFAFATHLAHTGWRLVIDARTASDLSVAAQTLQDLADGPVIGIDGDVTDPEHTKALVVAAENLGDLKLLVNNASTLGPSPLPSLAEYPLAALAHVHDVNVVAPLRLIQLALPALRRTHGTILNVTSDAAVEAYEGWGGYGSSKAALEQLSNVLAQEEPEVRVLWVDPGDMNTRMHQEAFPGEDISDRPLPEERITGLAALVDSDASSGRYTVSDLLADARRGAA